MSKLNDGGPAFPSVDEPSPMKDNPFWQGMSLRDWFAGQCLARERIAWASGDNYNEPMHIAGAAYALADAMLEARQKAEK